MQWTSTSISEKLHAPCLSAFAQNDHLDGVTTFFPSNKSNCWQSQPQIMHRYSQLLFVDKWSLPPGRYNEQGQNDTSDYLALMSLYMPVDHPIYINVPVINNKYIVQSKNYFIYSTNVDIYFSVTVPINKQASQAASKWLSLVNFTPLPAEKDFCINY